MLGCDWLMFVVVVTELPAWLVAIPVDEGVDDDEDGDDSVAEADAVDDVDEVEPGGALLIL